MAATTLDDFRDVGAWNAVGSGLASLNIGTERGEQGAALRLDFDFKGGGGFVIARRALQISLPERYEISFDIRGRAPANKFELKLSDRTGLNVWWFCRDALELTDQARTIRIPSAEVEFAWGPAGGGSLSELGFMELAIVAGPGGEGVVWIENLRLTDRTYRATPSASASSSLPGHGPEQALSGQGGGWRSAAGKGPQWLRVDFGDEREYGGLTIHWAQGARGRAFEVYTSDDAQAWRLRRAVHEADSAVSSLYLPATRARHLELRLLQSEGDQGFGIERLEVESFEFSRSLPAFFHALAQRAPRGSYPAYLYDQQSYWTPIALPSGAPSALMNEQGMVEVDKGGFSIAPCLFEGGQLITWADADITQALVGEYLPLPVCRWSARELELSISAVAGEAHGEPVLLLRYRVHNPSARARRVQLFATIVPFQVNPPWQAHQGLGGMRAISSLRHDAGVIWVDAEKLVLACGEPFGFGASSFAQGNIVEALRGGALPARSSVTDAFGYAAGALEFALDLAPGASRDVQLAIPFSRDPGVLEKLRPAANRPLWASAAFASAQFERARERWQERLAGMNVRLPGAAQQFADAAKTAVAHILTNRDGAALQPGPRRYTRSWIRDGATMAAALLRAGCVAEASAFIRWYAPFQADDGNVPCCVDERGPDWLVEHDSHGELIFTVMECWRFGADRAALEALWPAVLKAVDFIESLRATRLTTEFASGELLARRGLLPESASHEGYLAQHVHAYWDDFWALRGLRDAVEIAQVLGDLPQHARIAKLRDEFRATLFASLRLTIEARELDFLPGSVEWADFDPTAIANVALLDELHDQPRVPLQRTFDRYLESFRTRQRSSDWGNYTPYEIRSVTALIAMGRRDEAFEVASTLLRDRRPLAWNQWPEIAWRERDTPGHIGDVPHSWIGAEYVIAMRSMLLYEREHDRSVVIGAGVPAAWLEDGPVVATGLPTYYGALDLRIEKGGPDAVEITLSGKLTQSEVKLELRPPLPGRLRRAEVDGKAVAFEPEGVTLTKLPVRVVLRCERTHSALP